MKKSANHSIKCNTGIAITKLNDKLLNLRLLIEKKSLLKENINENKAESLTLLVLFKDICLPLVSIKHY
jgi:hypothetical protein